MSSIVSVTLVVIVDNDIDGMDHSGDEEQARQKKVNPEGAGTSLVEEDGHRLKIFYIKLKRLFFCSPSNNNSIFLRFPLCVVQKRSQSSYQI